MRSFIVRLSPWLLVGLAVGLAAAVGEARPQAVEPQASATLTYLPFVAKAYFAGGEWTQEAHDAQRTSYTGEEPVEPWTLLWIWNGADANGGVSCTGGNPAHGHCYDAPREGRTVTGGDNLYAPAGAGGLYAVRKADGQMAWHFTTAAVNGTPAYDPTGGFVYAGGANGTLYKLNANTGAVAGSYAADGPLTKAVLLVGLNAYVITDAGHLHKVNTSTMTQAWMYTAGAAAGTGLAYSATRDVILFGTEDLYVHAVNNATGAAKWHVRLKPAVLAGFPNQFLWYWPAVAEKHGVVFVRMRMDHNAGLWNQGLWLSNAEARAYLAADPARRSLFALSLDDGMEKFVPAVGYGGVEDLYQGQPTLTIGPPPIIRVLPDGTEVAYIPFRSGQSNPHDGSWYDNRWDSHMGEMVLDNTTVPGLVAGDMRFVRMSRYNGYGGNSYIYITDEQNAISMAGDTLFHAHWLASESVRITNRTSSLGLTYANPIATVNHPALIRQQGAQNCSDRNLTTHWTTCGLDSYNPNGGGGRYWDGPGWWAYWNVQEPPIPAGNNSYSDGMRPRYTYVSGGLLIVEGNGGDVMVFRHS